MTEWWNVKMTERNRRNWQDLRGDKRNISSFLRYAIYELPNKSMVILPREVLQT